MNRITVSKHQRHLHQGGLTTVHKHTRRNPFEAREVTSLPIRTAIIVPSTKKGDRPISQAEYRKRVSETRKFLSRAYDKKRGGYTSFEAQGGYVMPNGRLVRERTAEVESFAKRRDYLRNRSKLIKFAKRKGREWGQDSIGVEVEDNLYYVPTK